MINPFIISLVLFSFVYEVQAQSFDDILNANFANYPKANNQASNSDSIYSNQLRLSKINFAGPPIPIRQNIELKHC